MQKKYFLIVIASISIIFSGCLLSQEKQLNQRYKIHSNYVFIKNSCLPDTWDRISGADAKTFMVYSWAIAEDDTYTYLGKSAISDISAQKLYNGIEFSSTGQIKNQYININDTIYRIKEWVCYWPQLIQTSLDAKTFRFIGTFDGWGLDGLGTLQYIGDTQGIRWLQINAMDMEIPELISGADKESFIVSSTWLPRDRYHTYERNIQVFRWSDPDWYRNSIFITWGKVYRFHNKSKSQIDADAKTFTWLMSYGGENYVYMIDQQHIFCAKQVPSIGWPGWERIPEPEIIPEADSKTFFIETNYVNSNIIQDKNHTYRGCKIQK